MCKNIKKMLILDCGSIQSLEFINKMTSLEFLSFGQTNILDGNLSYCKRLNYVG